MHVEKVISHLYLRLIDVPETIAGCGCKITHTLSCRSGYIPTYLYITYRGKYLLEIPKETANERSSSSEEESDGSSSSEGLGDFAAC